MTDTNTTTQYVPHPKIHNFQDLTNHVFGYLTVLGYAGRCKENRSTWQCRCKCGKICKITAHSLNSAHVKSCGCLRGIIVGALNRTHRQCRTPIYDSWSAMWHRCTTPTNHKYSLYGGRGIQVCERWKSFANFFEDMGQRPTGTTLDRINNNGNYEPGNCRWATPKQQANNTRRSRILTFNGKSQTLSMWSDELHIPYSTLARRLFTGWSVNEALSTPYPCHTKTPRRVFNS